MKFMLKEIYERAEISEMDSILERIALDNIDEGWNVRRYDSSVIVTLGDDYELRYLKGKKAIITEIYAS